MAHVKQVEKPMKKPIYKKWWFWAIIIVVAIGVSSAGGGDNPEPTEVGSGNTTEEIAEATEKPTPKPTVTPNPYEKYYNVVMENELVINGNELSINLTTNIADGAIIEFYITNVVETIDGSTAEVEDGKASVTFILGEDASVDEYIGLIMFEFDRLENKQNQNIIDIYGENGENITGDLALDDTASGVFVRTNIVYYPNQQAVIDARKQVIIDEYNINKYSGSGQDVVTDIILPKSLSILRLKNKGKSNFIVYLHDETDKDLIANEIGNFNGTIPIFGEGPFMLEIDGDKWSAEFEPMFEAESGVFNGKGFAASGYFDVPEENIWTITHNGESNFIVYLHTDQGSELVQNEIGKVNGNIILDIPSGSTICVWEIQADGEWSINPKE